MDNSLIETLEKMNKSKIPMHMPGHKRNTLLAPYLKSLCAQCDITEISGADNLHDASGILLDSMKKASNLWHSDHSFYLINGSTCGILASIYACISSGDRVICARNCHKSVYNALELAQAKTVFIMPEADPITGGYGCINPKDIEKAIANFPDTKLIIITSPTYEGIVSDIKKVCYTAHEFQIPVMVDEAHGAHLGFGYGFPDGAVKSNADIVVQSLHKTLPSLTQTALLHINGNLVSAKSIAQSLAIFETSSPSYLLMASIDGCINLLCAQKDELFINWRKGIDLFIQKTKNLKKLKVLSNQEKQFFDFDTSKLVICTWQTKLTGNDLMEMLRQYGFECEMASLKYVIAMTGMGDTQEKLSLFADALLSIDEKCDVARATGFNIYPKLPEQMVLAYTAKRKASEAISISLSAGRICGEYVWAYPPGIPLVIPGEKITDEIIDTFKVYKKSGITLNDTEKLMPDKILVNK
ncbi:MAG: aminotransferase class I/II-fold pyridoxal phosphate-dependent enzyme [Bacillota bacterium]|nr:aminotransferase class I/II-fold pyridoxal phosphate-dependent enzyme [Bacillota bacterium]